MRLYGGSDVEAILVAANKITAKFLLLSDCHFGYLAATSLPYRKKKSDGVCTKKNVFYTPTHSGETWQFITKVRK
jgi:hypothetical protein